MKRSQMKFHLSFMFLLFISACQSEKETAVDPFEVLTTLVDQYANATVDQGHVSSLSVAIYKNGRSYHQYYGAIDSFIQQPPNDQSLFEIASISKVFTGSLMARAVTQNKLSLNQDIRDFLPYPYPNLSFGEQPIRLRDLLTHTLGFQTPKGLETVYQRIFSGQLSLEPLDYNMADLFEELQTVEVTAEPGSDYDYNNVGPEIVAYILEQLYEKDFQDIAEDFFDELGMQHTHLQEYEKHSDHLVHGHTEEGQLATIDKNPLLGGASGIITTLPDLLKFLRFQLESEDPLIREATKTLFENEEEQLGYFWDLGHGESEGFFYYKSGTSNGTQSIILLCPDSDYGQILIMNNTADEATNDWISLYNQIEIDLIHFPKINLWSKIEPTFLEDQAKGIQQYRSLKQASEQYFYSASFLNDIGYAYLYQNKVTLAIAVFEFATSEYPNDANLFDSLGEAYFWDKNFEKAKLNYQKSLALNPNNSNAKMQLKKIKAMNDSMAM